jgi:glucuronoarabinoxylan endo-1,4-beta-xylanase
MTNTNDVVHRSVRSVLDKCSLQVLLVSATVSYLVGCGGTESATSPAEVGGLGAVGGSSTVGGANGSGASSIAKTSGGSSSSSGGAATGGVVASGGSAASSGGSAGSATGGTNGVGAGGNLPTGGTTMGGVAAGGAATGGSPTGGRAPAGGAATGGAATGGKSANGGSGTLGGTAAAGGTAPSTGGAGASGGSTGTYVGTKTPGTAQTGDISISPATTYQTMDGFGIADVWQGKSTSSTQQRTLFWDPDQGIGMTLLRIGIDENGKIMGDAAFVDGPEVVKYGGKIWAAPWSPTANLKDNNNINNGGHLNTSAYESWASTLAAFPAYFKQNAGVDLWGLSPQNEPDFVASYRSCIYSASQMNAFIKVLGPKLQALNPPVKIIAAEPDVWSHTWNDGDKYGVAIEGDATVSSLVEIIATHDYGSNNNGTTRPSPPAGVKHRVWQTEITYTSGAAIGPGLDIARGIYSAVTSGGVSGWHYWWTQAFMDGGSTASPPKRLYAMGNFSKFVRPGYVRVGISGAPSSVQIVPFVSQTDGTVAIVALNSGTSAQQVSFFVSGSAWPGTVTPYVTSASSNLAAGTAITVSGGRFSGSLAAQSVTTFVGRP